MCIPPLHSCCEMISRQHWTMVRTSVLQSTSFHQFTVDKLKWYWFSSHAHWLFLLQWTWQIWSNFSNDVNRYIDPNLALLRDVNLDVRNLQFFLSDRNVKQIYQWLKYACQTLLPPDVNWHSVQACQKRSLDLLVAVGFLNWIFLKFLGSPGRKQCVSANKSSHEHEMCSEMHKQIFSQHV